MGEPIVPQLTFHFRIIFSSDPEGTASANLKKKDTQSSS